MALCEVRVEVDLGAGTKNVKVYLSSKGHRSYLLAGGLISGEEANGSLTLSL